MRALGITDGNAGNVAQVKALAEALGADLTLHTISLNPVWKYLPNQAYALGLDAFFSITKEKPVTHYDVIISCGRKGALVSASLKATGAKRVHIQDPQMPPHYFDAVIAMAHDKVKGTNVITTPFALHYITPEKLQSARVQWEKNFSPYPKPWNAVLIGGSTNKYALIPPAMHQLIMELDKINGSLLVTTSRRTGDANIAALKKHFSARNDVMIYSGEGENPYIGMLACADHIYVTNDSVNMMSEAIATGKPVTIVSLYGHENTKPARFAETVLSQEKNPQAMMQELAASIRQVLA